MSEPILDTHQHLLFPDAHQYAWTAGVEVLAGRAFTSADYAAAGAGTGIASALFMEVDATDYREETRTALALCDDAATLTRAVIANCRPEDGEAEFQGWLDAIAGSKVVALRRILHTQPDELSQGATFRRNIALLSERDLVFDLCVLERQLPLAADLVRACPNTRFVLDHCGVPDIAGGALDPWRGHVRTLAGFDNVAVKVSGITAYAKPGEGTAATVRPWVEHVIDCFGWDRVVWGGDWPVVLLNGALADWVAISREIVAAETPENRRKLFSQNAERIYLGG